MSNKFVKHESISQLHEYMGFGKPDHPLITIIDTKDLVYGEERVGVKLSSELYCIAQKDSNCAMDYGRNSYDFDEGVLMFTAPNQVITLNRAQGPGEVNGWLLYFHPDLIRNTKLGQDIDSYNFWSYSVHEALHLSEKEQETLDGIVEMIQEEISSRIDNHSQDVLVSHIQLLLNYSKRFYERQFNTRSAHHSDVVSKVESLLKKYFHEDRPLQEGPPSIQYLADSCNVSPGYLSDLLKKETGRTAKDHINDYIVSRAKNRLLSSTESISGIAYDLGFNYPHYFSRLFKSKTGMTPQEYRQQN